MYALNVLRTNGMSAEGLQEVFRAKIVSRLVYASPAWWGLSSQHDRNRINVFLQRAVKLNYYPVDGKTFEQICSEADENLLKNIVKNNRHVLHRYLPDTKTTTYNLINRGHNFILPTKDDRLFFSRTLFKYK